MTYLATYKKQPVDNIDYDCDCSEIASTAEPVTGVTTAVTVISGVEAVPTLLASYAIVNATTIKLWVTGGITGVSYKVEFTVTAAPRVKQGEIKISVRNT